MAIQSMHRQPLSLTLLTPLRIARSAKRSRRNPSI